MKRDTFTPMMPELKKYYVVYFVDIDVEKSVADKWRERGMVKGVPCYALLDRGGSTILAYGVGNRSTTAFTAWIQEGWKNKK